MAGNLTELILDRAHSAVISLDEQGCVTYWNPSAERMFGVTRNDALGRSVAELVIPERFRAAHTAGLHRFLADGAGPMLNRRVELAGVRADGSEFPVEITITAVRDGAQWTFTAFLQDIGWRREAEREHERLVGELREALRGSERRFDAIVGSLSDPVTIRNREHQLVYANRAALAQLGLESLEDLRSTAPRQIMADYRVFSEDGREVSMAEIPSVRILAGQSAEPLLIRVVHRDTGVERWSLLKAAPVLDETGEVEATIMLIEDVTEQKRAERRAAFLARASDVLASSLDYERTLRNVAELAVPEIADWCAVDLRDDQGDRVPVAVAHADPARLRLAEQLRAYEPARLDPEQGLGRVFRTGAPLHFPEISDEMLLRGAVDERHLELLRAVGMRAVAIVPIRLGNRTLGAMTLVNAESGRALEDPELALAEQIAARAAVAIENARLYGERARIAHTLQQGLLPAQLPHIPGCELASAYIPAVEGTEVGGDFYDAWQVNGRWFIAIGDVAGKGVEAAALTALVRHTLRATSEFISAPAALLGHLDTALKRQPTLSLCTALCLRLEADGAVLAVAGHPLPLCLTERSLTEMGKPGPLLGALDDVHWPESTVRLNPGTTLVLYTDGLTDAVGRDGSRYGLERLCAALGACRDFSAEGVVERLIDGLTSFQVGAHADDMAVLALRRLPTGAGVEPPPGSPSASVGSSIGHLAR